MKNFKWLPVITITLILGLIVASGCGVAQSDYDACLTQKTTLENERNTLQADYNAVQADYDAMKADYDAKKAELDSKNSEYDTLMTEKSALENAIGTLQSEIDATDAELKEIMDVYPPGDFPSRRDLEDWLLTNDVSTKPITTTAEAWIGRALEVQEDALLDGYIVSVDYDYFEADDTYAVFCTTIIDGYVWWWDPETDDINQDTTLLAVK